MTRILIDPPVGPHDPEADIRSWIAGLERLRVELPEHSAAIDRALQDAQEWLGLGFGPRKEPQERPMES
jgi:hypothetical protein